jgi:hypothetical protein
VLNIKDTLEDGVTVEHTITCGPGRNRLSARRKQSCLEAERGALGAGVPAVGGIHGLSGERQGPR